MSHHATQDVVVTVPAGDAGGGIEVPIRCACGQTLAGTDEAARCPRCGREIADVLGDLEQASLDGRARRRLGASLLIANHLTWLCMMAGWAVGIREDLRAALGLLAAAGPRAVTSIEVFRSGTMRAYVTSVGLLALLQLGGVWMFTTFRPGEALEPQRRAGRRLRLAYLTALATTVTLFAWIVPTRQWMLVTVHALEIPVGFLLGMYLTELGAAQRSRLLTLGGRVVSALLALSSFAIASSVFRSWSAVMRPHPSFVVGLAASGAGGLLLLLLLLRIRALLGRETSDVGGDGA